MPQACATSTCLTVARVHSVLTLESVTLRGTQFTQQTAEHVPLTPEYSVPKSDTTERTLIRTSRMSPTLPTIPRHIQLGNVIQMPLEALLKKLDHRQQLSRPGKGDTVSVCTYGESVSVAKTKWLGYLAHRFRARGNPVYTWTSAAVHVT